MSTSVSVAVWLAVAPALIGSGLAASGPPVLSVELENSITQPGNLRLIRPLVLYISDWSTEKPQAQAWTNTGTVTADVTRLPGTPGHWNATVRYAVVEAAGATPGTGTVTLHLTLHGTTVLGAFEGRFRDLNVGGSVRAGLTWDWEKGAQKRAAVAARPGARGAWGRSLGRRQTFGAARRSAGVCRREQFGGSGSGGFQH